MIFKKDKDMGKKTNTNAPHSKFKIGNCFLQNNKILVLKI